MATMNTGVFFPPFTLPIFAHFIMQFLNVKEIVSVKNTRIKKKHINIIHAPPHLPPGVTPEHSHYTAIVTVACSTGSLGIHRDTTAAFVGE